MMLKPCYGCGYQTDEEKAPFVNGAATCEMHSEAIWREFYDRELPPSPQKDRLYELFTLCPLCILCIQLELRFRGITYEVNR